MSGSERRFDGAERFVHWAHALLFFGLVATGALLVWSPASRALAWEGTRIVPLLHASLGIALLVAPFLPAARGRGGALARDLGEWLRWRSARPRFSAGQRLNALWSVVSWALLGFTGLVIWSDRAAPMRWREAAYDWHLLLALLAAAVAAGHVAVAALHPASLRAMLGRPRPPRASGR